MSHTDYGVRHRQELLHRQECEDEELLSAGQCAGGGWRGDDLGPGLLPSPHQGQGSPPARRCHLLQGEGPGQPPGPLMGSGMARGVQVPGITHLYYTFGV